MLPNSDNLLNNGITVSTIPSKTYNINFSDNIMTGTIDEIDALKQSIYLILSIERYDYIIYSWNYGIQLKDLFGKSTKYVCAALPARIKDALMQDDRINDVYDFVTKSEGNTVSATFTIDSILGTFQEEVSYDV